MLIQNSGLAEGYTMQHYTVLLELTGNHHLCNDRCLELKQRNQLPSLVNQSPLEAHSSPASQEISLDA